jgi:hypothetical protein
MVLAVTGIAASIDDRTVKPTNPTNIIAKAMCMPRNMSRNMHKEPSTPIIIGSTIMR